MEIHVEETHKDLGEKAAKVGAMAIREAIHTNGTANIILATGASQFGVLEQLSKETNINWSNVNGFHLDEYIGIPIDHPASFRLYLWKRFISKLPTPLKSFHYINPEKSAESACLQVGKEIASNPIDVAFIGIGENAHIAFNDPPANFHTTEPYIIVDLDEDCRTQQLGEGWFSSINEVPMKAISMSVTQIIKSKKIICSVPDKRKAKAVKHAIKGPVTPKCPASILNNHRDCTLFLDKNSASEIIDYL